MRVAGALTLLVFCVACGGAEKDSGASQPANTAAATAAGAATGAAAVTPAPKPEEPPPPTFREVTLPAGTTLRVDLKSAVASDTSHVEDAVRGELRQAVRVDGETVLPVGTEVAGVVTDVKESARVKGRAQIAFRFESIRFQGERYSIKTAAISRLAPATKGDDAKKIAIGAGAGAALGAILGGGGGAAKGAAIGGAGGTGVVLATKGKEVRLGPGADIDTRLTAPVTIRIKS